MYGWYDTRTLALATTTRHGRGGVSAFLRSPGIMGRRTGAPSAFAGKALTNAAVAPAAGSAPGLAGARWGTPAFGEWSGPGYSRVMLHVPADTPGCTRVFAFRSRCNIWYTCTVVVDCTLTCEQGVVIYPSGY